MTAKEIEQRANNLREAAAIAKQLASLFGRLDTLAIADPVRAALLWDQLDQTFAKWRTANS